MKAPYKSNTTIVAWRQSFFSTSFGITFGTLKVDEKYFFVNFLGFKRYWFSDPNDTIHAYSPGVNTSEKVTNVSTLDKTHLKCNAADGWLMISFRQPILFSLVLDEQPEYKVFCQTNTMYYKKKQINLFWKPWHLFRNCLWKRSEFQGRNVDF